MNHNQMGGYTSDINDITNIIENRKNQVGELPPIEKMTEALSKAPSVISRSTEAPVEEVSEKEESPKKVVTKPNNKDKKPTIVDELKAIKDRDGWTGYLDINEDLEHILPGASEEERNMSRLNKVITGESRPASHTAKEGVAWFLANVGLPLGTGAAKGASVASKGAKGLKAINEAAKGADAISGTGALINNALKVGKKAVKKTGKEVAKKKAERQGGSLISRLLKAGMQSGTEEIQHRAAKRSLSDVKTASKALNKYAPDLPMEMVNKLAKEEGAKAGAITLGANLTGERVANGLPDSGELGKDAYQKDEDLRSFDPRLEMGKGRKTLQFIKSLIDMDNLDPRKYPMDLIDNLITQTNAETGKWNKNQLDKLGDDEKIKLVKDVMKGKYNDLDSENLDQIMLDNYLRITNMDEE